MANLKKLYCLGRRKETLKNSIFHGPEKTSVSHTLGDMFSKKRETMWGLLIQRTICIYHYRKAPYLCVWCRHAIYMIVMERTPQLTSSTKSDNRSALQTSSSIQWQRRHNMKPPPPPLGTGKKYESPSSISRGMIVAAVPLICFVRTEIKLEGDI